MIPVHFAALMIQRADIYRAEAVFSLKPIQPGFNDIPNAVWVCF